MKFVFSKDLQFGIIDVQFGLEESYIIADMNNGSNTQKLVKLYFTAEDIKITDFIDCIFPEKIILDINIKKCDNLPNDQYIKSIVLNLDGNSISSEYIIEFKDKFKYDIKTITNIENKSDLPQLTENIINCINLYKDKFDAIKKINSKYIFPRHTKKYNECINTGETIDPVQFKVEIYNEINTSYGQFIKYDKDYFGLAALADYTINSKNYRDSFMFISNILKDLDESNNIEFRG